MIDEELIKSVIDYNKHRRFNYYNGVVEDPIIEFERILKARYNKISRIKKRFLYLLCNFKNIYFITFTLNDYYINLCDRSRKDLIKKCLYDFDDDIHYIINIDYGKKTERLHYHGIIATDSDSDLKKFLDLNYPSFSYTEKIRFSDNDYKRVSKYLNKLSNHACKDTTKRSRVLYNFKGYDIYDFDKDYKKELIDLDKKRVGLSS